MLPLVLNKGGMVSNDISTKFSVLQCFSVFQENS